MNSSTRLPVIFLTTLLLGLLLSFIAHYSLLSSWDYPPLQDRLLLSYVVNFILAAVIFLALFILRKKLKNAIGFLFMGGSFLKFAVFFVVFYPIYREDGEIQRTEFAAFFVPYVVALILETYFTSKMLLKNA